MMATKEQKTWSTLCMSLTHQLGNYVSELKNIVFCATFPLSPDECSLDDLKRGIKNRIEPLSFGLHETIAKFHGGDLWPDDAPMTSDQAAVLVERSRSKTLSLATELTREGHFGVQRDKWTSQPERRVVDTVDRFASELDDLRSFLEAEFDARQRAIFDAPFDQEEFEAPITEAGMTGMPTTANKSRRAKGKNINAQMLALAIIEPSSLYWTCQQWADRLKCRPSTVCETKAWEKFTTARMAEKPKSNDRRRNGDRL